MDVSQILLTYLAITIAWPFIVLSHKAILYYTKKIVGSLSEDRWWKLLDSIGDKTVFAGLAIVVGNVYTFLWHVAEATDWHVAFIRELHQFQLPLFIGGINLVIAGYILIRKVVSWSKSNV